MRTNSIDSCCESVRAKFQVDKYRHFFSAMSRVSPSPDWNVGVDSLDLCDHSTCTWRKKIELNLDPWDAGMLAFSFSFYLISMQNFIALDAIETKRYISFYQGSVCD